MPRGGDWTVDDLAKLPDDGLQYELVDGILLVSPAPRPLHQRVVGELYLQLRQTAPEDFEVYLAPLDFQPTRRRSLQPDLLVVRRGDMGLENLKLAPLLAVEVLSPSTRAKDLVLKRALYAESGVASYWVVDPDAATVTVFALREENYVELAAVSGEQAYDVHEPYPVTLIPLRLVR